MSINKSKTTSKKQRLLSIKASEVIERIKQTLDLTTDLELVNILGVSKSTVAGWRKRDTVPYEAAVIAAKRGRESLGWIITGERDDSLSAGMLDGPVDHQLMQVILFDNILSGRWNELLAGLPDNGKKAAQLARIVTTEYNKNNEMMKEAVGIGQMSRVDFLQSLQRAVEGALEGTPPTELISQDQLEDIVFDAVRFSVISTDENKVQFPMTEQELNSFASVVSKLALGEGKTPLAERIAQWLAKHAKPEAGTGTGAGTGADQKKHSG